jgi:hypothetical protein
VDVASVGSRQVALGAFPDVVGFAEGEWGFKLSDALERRATQVFALGVIPFVVFHRVRVQRDRLGVTPHTWSTERLVRKLQKAADDASGFLDEFPGMDDERAINQATTWYDRVYALLGSAPEERTDFFARGEPENGIQVRNRAWSVISNGRDQLVGVTIPRLDGTGPTDD